VVVIDEHKDFLFFLGVYAYVVYEYFGDINTLC